MSQAGDDGDTIEFGGHTGWLFARLPKLPHLPPLPRPPRLRRPRRLGRTIAAAAAVCAATGVAAGVIGVHLAARPHPRARWIVRAFEPGPIYPTAVSFTGVRCARQQGKDLRLGIEIQNQSASSITIDRVSAEFKLGGLRTVATGTGPCASQAVPTGPGGSAESQQPVEPIGLAGSITTLGSGSTGWITITVSVLVRCPQPLPVWFKIGYAEAAGPTTTAVIAAFPDLGTVRYGHCAVATSA
jgi:hypothetical protein